jgi:Ca2+/H+ antiporter
MKSFLQPSMNWLLAFIPISVVLERADVPPPVLFFSAALAIVPIARLIVLATEQLATRTGNAVGGLLNATMTIRGAALGGHRQRSARDCRDVDDCPPIRDVS